MSRVKTYDINAERRTVIIPLFSVCTSVCYSVLNAHENEHVIDSLDHDTSLLKDILSTELKCSIGKFAVFGLQYEIAI